MKRKKLSNFHIKMIAAVIVLILAAYMYFSDNINQHYALIGIGGLLILNAYSMGKKK